jgi:hypothetical protein
MRTNDRTEVKTFKTSALWPASVLELADRPAFFDCLLGLSGSTDQKHKSAESIS